jgi:hypothetical protein
MDDIEQIQKFLIKFYVAFYKLNQVHKCVLVMGTVKKKRWQLTWTVPLCHVVSSREYVVSFLSNKFIQSFPKMGKPNQILQVFLLF